MLQRLTEGKEWKFFSVLPKAAPGLAFAWFLALLFRGVLPAAFAIAMGVLVGAVQHDDSLLGPLALVGAIFILLQVLSPIHQALSANLGDRTAAWLYDRLTEACVRHPGMGHLEDPKLTSDLTVARDFDLGMTGPPLTISYGQNSRQARCPTHETSLQEQVHDKSGAPDPLLGPDCTHPYIYVRLPSMTPRSCRYAYAASRS